MQKAQIIEGVVAVVLFLYVIAAMLPTAVTDLQCASGPGIAKVTTLWAIIPLFAVIALILLVYTYVVKKQG